MYTHIINNKNDAQNSVQHPKLRVPGVGIIWQTCKMNLIHFKYRRYSTLLEVIFNYIGTCWKAATSIAERSPRVACETPSTHLFDPTSGWVESCDWIWGSAARISALRSRRRWISAYGLAVFSRRNRRATLRGWRLLRRKNTPASRHARRASLRVRVFCCGQ